MLTQYRALQRGEAMRTIDVFFYGLFMDKDLLQSKGVRPANLRTASVSGFHLRIGERATLVPAQSGRVYGLIASLSHADLERLYSEPGLRAYRPEAVLIHLANGEVLAALCFNLPEPPSDDERNSDYASKLRSLAERLNFPPEYIASIQITPP
jgi:gamma-glutamyl AIG2-like cyclotransferase